MKIEYIETPSHKGGIYKCLCGKEIILMYDKNEPKPTKREWCFDCIEKENMRRLADG